MPVEFLTDDEVAAYGRYTGPPSQADLERVFFLLDCAAGLPARPVAAVRASRGTSRLFLSAPPPQRTPAT
jgi:hypothetical protein